jgi:site-specific DNA recombinase
MDDKCVALYARVSSQRQAGEATIQSQIAALRERIAAEGHAVDDERSFLDDGFSGATLVRPALERLRDLAWSGGLDLIYIHSPDRLARKLSHQMLLLDEFKKHGVEIVFLNHDARDASPENLLLVQMQGMFAEYERSKILERSRRGRRFAARQGKVSVLGHAPYGYRYITKRDGDGEARYDVRADEARVVRDVFCWVGEEGLSLRRVAARLNEERVPTAKGGPAWDVSTIRGLLQNPAYTGTARYGKTRLSPRKPGRRPRCGDPPVPRQETVAVATPLSEQEPIRVPRLIGDELFAAAAARLEENRKRHREQKRGTQFLLSGLLVCQRCGRAYCGRRHPAKRDGTQPVWYRCLGTDRYRHGGVAICANSALDGASLEERVWSDVRSLLEDPERLRREFERRLSRAAEEDPDAASRAASIRLQKSRLGRLIDAYEQGLIDRTEFEPRVRRVKEQLAREEEAMKTHQQQASDAVELKLAIENLREFTKHLRAELNTADPERRRKLLKLLIKRIEVDEEEVRIIYRVQSRPFAHRPASPKADGEKLQLCLRLHSIAQAKRSAGLS